MSMRPIVEEMTIETDKLLAGREPGANVDLVDHPGEPATEADLAARDKMASLARLRRPEALFVSEDSNRPADIAYPNLSKPAEVFLADPCDGSRQFAQLGFGYASCVSYHTYEPGQWWNVDAASITVSGKTISIEGGVIVGPGGNTDDSTDLRQYTTREKVRIPGCVAVGASSASEIPLLTHLMNVFDEEDGPPLRVWNTGGNPITLGLLRSRTMVAVQLHWSTQWDTLFALYASAADMGVYPLVWGAWGEQRPVHPKKEPDGLDPYLRRLWWGRPRWAPFERKCIPPIVVGPRELFTYEVYRIVQASGYAEIARPAESRDELTKFESAWERDNDDLRKAIANRERVRG